MYVVAAVRFDPTMETVIAALLEVAVKLNQTPLVVVEVAPPHVPVGAEFTASCKSPEVGLQLTEGVSGTAVLQVAWEYTFEQTHNVVKKHKRIARVMLVLMNRI